MSSKTMQRQIDEAVSEAVRTAVSDAARKAGQIGGPARAAALTPRRRKQIAKKAAKARWGKA